MGIAALPDWLVTPYESQGLIKSIPLGALGLKSSDVFSNEKEYER